MRQTLFVPLALEGDAAFHVSGGTEILINDAELSLFLDT